MVKPLKPTTDPAYDILRSERQPLSSFFAPESVAVIGATDKAGSVGRTLLWNLISNPFGGTIYPINPKRHSVLGIPAYSNITAVPDPVDLAIIATPAPTVPGVISECVEAGVKSAIIISAGFKEIGQAGLELERQILEKARGKMRIIGPNCLGLMSPRTGLNATFASTMARPGNLAFISQSGALCTAVLDWSFWENVGFSAFISIGSMLDVNWGDLIYYFGDDPHTQSIVIYMESIGDARSFLSAAREVALTKPIIVIKTGRTEAAAKASASHTGSLAGSDDVLDAAFRRCGVVRVNTISELFDTAEVLAKQPRRPKGPRMTIITNAGGPGVLATDALIGTGGELAELSPETIDALDKILPPHWSHGNPIDILGDADPQRYTNALEIAVKDPNSDGLLVILTPQAMTDPTQIAEQLKPYAQATSKPVFASWMGGSETKAGETLLNHASIPTYPYPDAAARLFNLMWRYTYNLRGIYETPMLPTDEEGGPDRTLAQTILKTARDEGRTILTEVESKQILAAYNIPIVPTGIAKSEAQAVEFANSIGYPVVVKLFSETITHKTDVGGVQLNLRDEEAVAVAYRTIQSSVTEKVGAEHFLGVTVQPMIDPDGGYELIIGSSVDPQFGPVLVFGSGGQLVEVFKDRAIALPPLNTTLARRMMEQTKIYKALQGVRGRKPVDTGTLEKIMVRFSQLVVEQPWIKEIDINPLLASSERLTALDARVVLHEADVSEEKLSKPAIRPYPTQYIAPWTLKDNTPVTIRPIRPEDEPLIVQFHKTLSEESVYLRYFNLMKLSRRIAHERLTRICFIDYDREMALVADYKNPETGEHEIIGVARLSKMHGVNEAEFAMLISDTYQRRGLGSELLRRLVKIGRDEKLDRITAQILAENTHMQRVSEKVGFHLQRVAEDLVKAELELS
ncbi:MULTISPECIES: bifunctional acetate--CoA ligase family protein/GNAT family N-acetyltransferase [unclassified Coleofasciculus]|uniref:bifunctional acetate--CoA ligase family protein/GNAT family N-acetyltransferase n=1 Tax=unclassified Coleofasciculus TaxID=2692782 RepID=UPI0018813BF6|nr:MULTISPECIES: bifunctional acetate--CoA ligase family protein/GNAT family N-acetyltransferase [unclassified Coleofasciculus]MBE9129604.1 bifunctional acetate--CoA ligase family protein/GNAT family N-acetyltransferase [Coleofasciculus sp. LEGE 07081]MBE9151352.1 bifunctional acetate--CoA ligase family protein/GNAT family N-acetyltransferase [Coleofasciculus sp. LEGE 07092]